jgi:hypothetical protein
VSNSKPNQHRLNGCGLSKRLLAWSSLAAMLLRAIPAAAQAAMPPAAAPSAGAVRAGAAASNSNATSQISPNQSLHCEVDVPAVQSPLPSDALAVIDAASGAIQDVADARKLVLAAYGDEVAKVDSPSFYAVIHIVKWKDPTKTSKDGAEGNNWTTDSSYEHWYVYHSKNWNQATLAPTIESSERRTSLSCSSS